MCPFSVFFNVLKDFKYLIPLHIVASYIALIYSQLTCVEYHEH